MIRSLLLIVATTAALVGCSLNDMMFGALGSHYTADGHDRESRRLHYDAQTEVWEGYRP